MNTHFKAWQIPPTPRALPIALAHRIARTPVNSHLMAAYNRIYAWLTPSDKLVCRAELDQVRRARRGEAPALVQ